MAEGASNNNDKKLIQIDVCSDTVCPWCFVGKRNLDKAIDLTKDQFHFEIRWHPYFLNANAPKEGVPKKTFYEQKFGIQAPHIFARMAGAIVGIGLERQVFKDLGLEYDTSGLTGSTMDSHRLIYFAGQQGHEKQHNLVDELCLGYFTEGKFIGDREFLLECARKVGVEGAAEFLDDPNNGLKEVKDEYEEYSAKGITGVPYYSINGKLKLSGGQPPHVFVKAFETAANAGS